MMFEKNLATLIESILNKGVEEQKSSRKSYFEVDKIFFENLVDYLRSNEDIASVFDEKMMNTGNGYASITLNSLAEWLVYSAVNSGTNETIKLLNDFIMLNHTPVIAILAVSGIEPSERIQLSDTIELIPFIDLPQSKPKNALYPSLIQDNPGLSILNPMFSGYNPPKAALVKKIELYPKAYDNDSKKPNATTIEYLDLYEACEFLTLHSNATPVSLGSWTELEESVPCKQMLGTAFSYPSPEVIASKDISINMYEWNKLKSIYQNFTNLDQETRDLLRIPIQRLNQARRRQRREDKAIDQGIALEALFLNDKPHMEQISFMLRLRASLLLGNSVEERQNLINFLKAFYSCRSQATHMGKLDNKVKISNRGKIEVNELLKESDQFCIESITKIINNGRFPDWNELMLGAGLDV